MALTPFDVSNLNRSIQGLGQSFADRRQEADAAQMRQMMLQRDIERNQAEQAHYQRMESAQTQGHVDAYLKPDDADEEGVIRFTGPPQGLQTLIDEAAKKGKTLRRVQAPNLKPFAVIKSSTQIGDLEFHASDPEQLGKIADLVKKMGGAAVNHHTGTREIDNDRAAAELEDQADTLDQRAETQIGSLGPDAYGQMKRKANTLRARATAIRAPRADPTALQTVTETQEPTDTRSPKVVISRKVPIGTSGTAARPSGAAPTPITGLPKPGDVRKGYRFKGGDPSDKSNWVKVQ